MRNIAFEKFAEGIYTWVDSEQKAGKPVNTLSLALCLTDLYSVTFAEKKYSNERAVLKHLITRINPSYALGYFAKSKKK